MSVLSQTAAKDGIGETILTAARPIFAAAIWAWYDANAERVLFSKWGFIRIRVSDFRLLIEEIAGPHPSPVQP